MLDLRKEMELDLSLVRGIVYKPRSGSSSCKDCARDE